VYIAYSYGRSYGWTRVQRVSFFEAATRAHDLRRHLRSARKQKPYIQTNKVGNADSTVIVDDFLSTLEVINY